MLVQSTLVFLALISQLAAVPSSQRESSSEDGYPDYWFAAEQTMAPVEKLPSNEPNSYAEFEKQIMMIKDMNETLSKGLSLDDDPELALGFAILGLLAQAPEKNETLSKQLSLDDDPESALGLAILEQLAQAPEKLSKQLREKEAELAQVNGTLQSVLAQLSDLQKACQLQPQEEAVTNSSLPVSQKAVEVPLTNLVTGSYYISIPDQTADWHTAAKVCESYGLALVSIETDEENEALYNALRGESWDAHFWTSGNNLEHDMWNRFYWGAGTENPMGMSFTDWGQDEPDNAGGNEHCVHIMEYQGISRHRPWNDLRCDAQLRFICEK